MTKNTTPKKPEPLPPLTESYGETLDLQEKKSTKGEEGARANRIEHMISPIRNHLEAQDISTRDLNIEFLEQEIKTLYDQRNKSEPLKPAKKIEECTLSKRNVFRIDQQNIDRSDNHGVRMTLKKGVKYELQDNFKYKGKPIS